MTPKTGHILVVDDDEDVLQAAKLFLKQHVIRVDTEQNPKNIPNLLLNHKYDLVLLDMNFTGDVSGGTEGFHWLQKILEIDPSVAVVFITAYGDVEKAVKAIKEGATDFVLKPWHNEKLLATINAALQLTQSRREVDTLKSREETLQEDLDQRYKDIIGKSPAITEVFHTIDKIAKTDANVLIQGENGTGKELVARAIHRQSNRNNEAFINVDLGAIAENLFESELFGHVKGAFTDAKSDRAGRFEIASGGTLFLDEIGNVPLPLQAKLLSALQNRTITRVGSHKPIDVDIRLISASNRSLHEMVNNNEFRQDLLYRINTIELKLPPLRDRTEDIPLLAKHYLQVYTNKYQKDTRGIAENALKKLELYAWPGNIRELQHAVERAVIMTEDPVLQPHDFLLTAGQEGSDSFVFDDFNLERIEKTVIRKALEKHGGNITRAATELGLTRASLYRRMEKYELSV